MSVNNTICWVDIPVTDLDRSIQFYSAVLGKPVTKQDMGPGCEFGLLPHENNNVSGCLTPFDGSKPSEQGALVYLSVNGRHEDAEKAVAANGGTVLEPKHPIGPYGFRTLFRDCEGNRVALHSEAAA